MSHPARLPGFACERGHAYLHPHDACPQCGGRLRSRSIPPQARLTLVTTVYVTPQGDPVGLGIAVTVRGRARTLCRVDGTVRGLGYDRVVLEKVGDAFVAATAHNRARRPTAAAGRRS